MDKQIQIQFAGAYQLDATTEVKSPLVTALSATDNFVDNVSVVCLFSGIGYSVSRSAGSFQYADTWTNEDVESHITAWMNERKV
jgi:CRISPR/Cas system CMR-associated protein Cmr1 (group 7 of RAMP superfamily)